MTAKVDLFRLKQVHQDGDDDDHYVDRSSPDPDARFGRKSPKKGFYGYKSHMVQDADAEFLLQATTTPGNVPDGAVLSQVAQSQAQEMTGDKAYGSKTNRTHLPNWGFPTVSYLAVMVPGGPVIPGGNGPKSSASLRSANSFTAYARPAIGAWKR
jgi:hypothetical protein